ASSVWAPGCDSLQLHSQVLIAQGGGLTTHGAPGQLRFVNGPEDYGGEDNVCFRSPRRLPQKWEPVKFNVSTPPLPPFPKGLNP
ncbi:unnamed protein product, partial [Staurois parvus]